MIRKADASDFSGRFREIISDPLNLLIERHPMAGTTDGECVVLHNGNRVPLSGKGAYYGRFSEIFILNRGVHEPLEEFAFQQVLPHLPAAPVMLELGAYWGHYSMWMKQSRPQAQTHLVEPEAENLTAGQSNFARNGYEGTFEQAFVGHGQFQVDAYLERIGADHLTVLHCDIQGFEGEMLDGAARALADRRVSYLFISTHSQDLHTEITARLNHLGYRIEASADFDHQTTSYDGFILAVNPDLPAVFAAGPPLGREDIAQADPKALINSILRHVPR